MNRRSFVSGLLGGTLASIPILGSVASDRLNVDFDGPFEITTDVTHSEDVPVSLTTTVVQRRVTEEQPGIVEFTLQNISDSVIPFGTGIPKPFGVLRGADAGPVLWTPSYEEDPGVEIKWDGLRVQTTQQELEVALSPGDSVSERYQVRSSDRLLRSGRFEIDAVSGGFPGQYHDEIDVALTITSN